MSGCGRLEDLDEELRQLGYGNQWEAQIETAAIVESERRAKDIERLNEYNRRNPEKHKEAVRKAVKARAEAAKALVELASKLYGDLPCRSCGKPLTASEILKYRCSKCKAKTKEKEK